ncbi:GTP cyclohydrolase II [Micromonospora taraxaci]|uniref:GTP cyclohydrolase II n=1 Tax=Micromonospora taraxaci TaxID=1316803 RepID=UPI0034029EC2
MIERVETSLQTQHGSFRILCYDEGPSSLPDFVLIKGDVEGRSNVLTRIQSECITGHVLQSLSCDCYEQLQHSLSQISRAPEGILIYLRQEGRGIGLADKLRSYVLQKRGFDTVDANLELGHGVDDRSYAAGVRILNDLAVASVVLMTNNPSKSAGVEAGGIAVEGTIEVPPVVREQNLRYLETKRGRMGHILHLPE